MGRYLFLLLFIPVSAEINAATCQTLEQVIEFSEAAYDCGNYEAAARDFQRAWLFTGDSMQAGLEQRIGDCFYNLDEFERATEFYNLAILKTADDSTRNAILFDIAACHIRAGEFFNALSDLELLTLGDHGQLAERRWFLTGICNWGIYRYDEAFSCFGLSVPAENRAAMETIKDLQADFSSIRHPNPRLAGWLSIIPGAGQFYCLEWGPGFNSLVLNGSLMLAGYFSVIVFKNNLFLLNLLPWIQRYYAGGILQAKELAENRLLAKKNRIYQRVIDAITENQSLE